MRIRGAGLVALALIGCISEEVATDAGPGDATVPDTAVADTATSDTTNDTGADATTTDAGADATMEAAVDSGQLDTGVDSGIDTGVDSGVDSGLGCDGGLILCGNICVDTQSDPNNCSMCGTSCNGKACCSGTCKDTKTDVTNCGQCGIKCTVANGTPGCMGGTCNIQSCFAGYDNCDSQYQNGCEANLKTDAKNCGQCNKVCSNMQTCVNGICQ